MRARLEALKQQNEEEYVKYLDEVKNQRLLQLLKETDQYLEKV